jgi:hypothetical protein
MALRNRQQAPQPPDRSNTPQLQGIVEAERAVLRAICAFNGDAAQRDHLLRELADYSWRDPDHAVVYRALRSFPTAGEVANWREVLPAAATRMGFPDLNWEYYFGDQESVRSDVERAIIQLFETGKEARGRL